MRDDCCGDLSYSTAINVLAQWCNQGLKNIRFSGGEPLLYKDLPKLIHYCKINNVEHIAISTNGSFALEKYKQLIDCGVNDFSISFDACCSVGCNTMSGRNINTFDTITHNIEEISKLTYVRSEERRVGKECRSRWSQ